MTDIQVILAEHVDHRLTVTGMFERCSINLGGIRQWQTALLQDVFVTIEGKDHDFGHAWVQHAEAIKNLDLTYGDRIRCNCRIKPYKKRLPVPNKDGLMLEQRYSLSWPTDIEVINRVVCQGEPVVQSPVVPLPNEQPTTPSIRILRELKELASRAGGWDALKEIIEVLQG